MIKRVIIDLTTAQHERLHKTADKTGRPAKHLLEGVLTDFPKLSEQEKRETLRALKMKSSDVNF